MRIAICDDDEFYRKQILYLLDEYSKKYNNINLSFYAFSKAEDLLKTLDVIDGFDIYILDIVMPNINGIELGFKIRQSGYDGSIVYLTSSPEFAVDSYKVNAFNYILKPIEPNAFLATFNEVLTAKQNKIDNCIPVKTKQNDMLISFDSILYVQPYKHTIIYHLANSAVIESSTIRLPFAEAISTLLADKRFYLCRKSLAINLHNVTQIGVDTVVFKDNIPIFFSKSICRDLHSAWSVFWFGKNKQ